MNKSLFTFIIVLILSFTVSTKAATNGVVDSVLNTTASAVKYVTGSPILDSLIPDKKNCNYVKDGRYEPFSDIKGDFPGATTLGGTTGKNNAFCIDVRTQGTESLIKLLFTTAISVIIILTVINISISGIQFMTQEANIGKKGEAKKRLQNSLIALMLGLLSYAILYTVNKQLVEFTFNPSGIDTTGAVNQGIQRAALAAQQQSLSSTISSIEAIMAPTVSNPNPSSTGFVNRFTGAPCVPFFVGPTAPGTPTDPCIKQDSLLGAYAGGIPTGNYASWNETKVENWVRTLSNGERSTDGRLIVSVFSSTRDTITDVGTSEKRGNANNLLREGSVALSPDLIAKYKPRTGQEIFINGICIGFYEDATAGVYKGVTFNNTVDIYDENGTLGTYLKNIPSGQWVFSLGTTIRPQITNRPKI